MKILPSPAWNIGFLVLSLVHFFTFIPFFISVVGFIGNETTKFSCTRKNFLLWVSNIVLIACLPFVSVAYLIFMTDELHKQNKQFPKYPLRLFLVCVVFCLFQMITAYLFYYFEGTNISQMWLCFSKPLAAVSLILSFMYLGGIHMSQK